MSINYCWFIAMHIFFPGKGKDKQRVTRSAKRIPASGGEREDGAEQ